MRPAVDDNLLPDNAAANAVNAWLYGGKIEGLRLPRLIHTLATSARRAAFRIPKGATGIQNILDSYWLEFDNANTSVVKGSANATDQRYYWADGVSAPRYTLNSLVASTTYYYVVTAVNGTGETVASNEVSQAVTGNTSKITLSWGAVAGATGYYVYRGIVPGGEFERFDVGTNTSFDDDGTVQPDGSFFPPDTDGSGGMSAPTLDDPVLDDAAGVLQAGSFVLGVPAPATKPTIATSGGSSSTNESRAYVYTHVTAQGEEGQPSPPSTVTTYKNDGTWTLTIPSLAADDRADRNITKTRIYRTVTNDQGNADYFFVAEIDVDTLTYADSATSDVIVLNNTLPSASYATPPQLQGMVEMPNGMIIGWLDNQIWFCEPYLPHAWPIGYQLATDYKIVGIGVVGQTAIICTQGAPYTCTGVHPSSMTLAKIIGLGEPCVSQGSIVAAPEGVYYASQNGLVLCNSGTSQVWSARLVSKEKWQSLLNVARLNSALLGRAYVTFSGIGTGAFEATAFEPTAFEEADFSGTRNGALIDLDDERIAFSLITSDDPVYNVLKDPWTAELFYVRGQTVVWQDLTNNALQGSYTWRSKIFQMARPTNLGAGKIFWDLPPGVTGPAATLNVYANGALLCTKAVPPSGQMFRLPAGNRYDFYQFEIVGNLLIKNVQIATTPKELAQLV